MTPTLTPGAQQRHDEARRALTNLDAAQEHWTQARTRLLDCQMARDAVAQAARVAGMPMTRVAVLVGQTTANAIHKYGSDVKRAATRRAAEQRRNAPPANSAAGRRAAKRLAAAVERLTHAQADVDDAARAEAAAETARVKAVATCRQLLDDQGRHLITWTTIAERVGMAQPNAVSHFGRRLQVERQVTITVVDPAGT
jgi:AraC-like DNA-binding protein